MKYKIFSFEECLEKIKETKKIKKKDYLVNGKYPVVSQEDALINGYTNDKKLVFDTRSPVIIFGDHTRKIKYIDFSFALGADGAKIIKTKPFINPKYFFYYLCKIMPKNLGYARHYKLLKKNNFNIPPLIEQQRIVAKLDAAFAEIDGMIDLNQNSSLKLNLIKASLLKNEFEKHFKKLKLKDVVVYDKIQGKNSNLPYVGMENISSETMQIVGDIKIPENTSSTFKFDNSHVLFGRLRPYLKKILIPDFKGQCSTEIFCLKPNGKVKKSFLAYWLLSPNISNKINNSTTGARMPRANMRQLLNYEFPDTSLSNQQKITNKINLAFASLENLRKIKLNTVSNLKALKLSILSQAFGQIR